MKKKDSSRRSTLIRIVLAFFLVFVFLPYVIPLSSPSSVRESPFENSSFVEINGFSFHKRLFSPEKLPAKGKLLLVHGLAGSTFSFETSAPLLAKEGYYVLLVDLPSFGYSDRKSGYNHAQSNRAKDLWELLKTVDRELPKDVAALSWHLGGHSMGGGTVTAMAMQEDAASLILIDGALFNTARGGFLAEVPLLKRWLQVALEHLFIREKRIQSLLGSAYGKTPSSEQVEGYLRPLLLPGTASALMDVVVTAKNEDPQKLRDLSLPIFALWGSRDSWVPLEELHQLQEIRPDPRVSIIEDAAHCPMETHPQDFVETLLQWLSEH